MPSSFALPDRRSLLAALFAVASAFLPSRASAQPTVDSYQALRTPYQSSDAAAMDLDGDGARDVVVSDYFATDVFVFWNDGLGWFEERTRVPIGMASHSAATGDFDVDGDGDAVVVGAGGIVSLLNDGGRTFTVLGPYFPGLDFSRPLVVDANGDGILDLVGPASASPSVTVLLGTGTGAFLPFAVWPLAGVARRIAVADVDGDSVPDVVALDRIAGASSCQIEVLSGATGAPIRSITAGTSGTSLAAADFDEDGVLDLAVDDGAALSILTFRGAPGGAFLSAGQFAASRTSDLVAADFDSDSHLDLAASGSFSSSGPTLYRGDGRLGFARAGTFASGGSPYRILATDVDRDGRADLLAAGTSMQDVAVLLNRGAGDFAQPRRAIEIPPPSDSLAGDFDADGHVDAVIASPTAGQLAFLGGDGTGSFDTGTTVGGAGPIRALASGDLDGDGILDVLGASSDSHSLLRGRGNGRGGFALDSLPPLSDGAGGVRHVALADLDSDGDVDVVAAGLGGSRPAAGAVLLNEGAGGFSPPIFVGLGSTAVSVAIADADGQFGPDLLFVAGRPDRLLLARRLESARPDFGALEVTPLGGIDPRHVVAADLNADGAPDVVVSSSDNGGAVLLGLDDGRFSSAERLEGIGRMSLAGDFDLDGAVDIASLDARFTIRAGAGTGRFATAQSYGAHAVGIAVAAADFDEDGLDDFVVVGGPLTGEGRLTLLIGRDRSIEAGKRGNVNSGRGVIADVLFVNDSTGGPDRRLTLETTEPFAVFVSSTPAAAGPQPFALYAWTGEPRREDVRRLPKGLGVTCMPTPLSGGEPRPRAIWNNFPRSERWLGAPRFPSSPAPTVLVSRPRGPRGPIVFFLQGIIADPGAPNGRAAVTNGIVVDVK